ncbi:MAG: OmpA family protein [Flavobacteriales bacterium]|jgi:chemotaxis protein MotB|nr:OmpA family protein [Flavobacteriales bacterium]MDC3394977.1 OmpA family protein [Flavobacteriales bacterium]MDG1348876.1 OmpA family protein [Flavobacteriales bacterium]|tara:strand:+ start:1648 stop:2646 length:999 start_codon:yes stop_codon:yes gene_type:complete
MQKSILYIGVLLLGLSACVTPKIHNALIADQESTKLALTSSEKKALALASNLEEKEGTIVSLQTQISELRNDSVQNGKSLVILQNKYDELSDAYDLLTSKNSRYMADKAKETKKLLEQLEEAQTELFAKEDELNKLSNSLDAKEQELKIAQEELEARSVRVTELETIINKKDSMVTALKQSISKALRGLEGEGLTIEQRNGKVYISLEEDLLFASGKYTVNSGGVAALNKLATALAPQKDLEILVEGHTDSIPLSGRGLVKDNWDLSVMRATNVVKVLTKNPSLNPLQLTAAGRAEFVPIASNKTKEGRGANRRIEMILSPNLDDLYNLLEE